MANKYLARDDAPLDSAVWGLLDETMKHVAKGQLVGRRILETKGPYGLGLKAVPLADQEGESGLIASRLLPVYYIQEPFTLGTRDLASYERDGLALDTKPLADATLACVRLEEEIVFHGAEGAPGLMTVEGAATMALASWEEVGTAANDVIQAVTMLDDAGYHGPYSLALAPKRYNLLYRLYPRGKQSELEHIESIVKEGVFKAPILVDGGVLLAANVGCASIVLGQDMYVGYVGPAGSQQEFTVSESLALRIRQPGAICVLEG